MTKFNYHGKIITASTKKQAIRSIIAQANRVLSASAGSWSGQYGNFKLELQVVKGGSLSATMTNPGLDELENFHKYNVNINPEFHALIPAGEVQEKRGASVTLKNGMLAWLATISEQLMTTDANDGRYDESEFEVDEDGEAETYKGEWVDDDQYEWFHNLTKQRNMDGLREKVGDLTPVFKAIRSGFSDLPWDKIADTCGKYESTPSRGSSKALDKNGALLKKGDMVRVPEYYYGSGGTAMIDKIKKCPDGTFDVTVRSAFPEKGSTYYKSPKTGTFKASEVVKIRYGKLIHDSDIWNKEEHVH